jgi:2-(1,2-epoxy-1,2-dihydrophenyl)acetyl-CoA isomerase
MTSNGAIRVVLDDGVLRLTLARPQRMNTIDFAFADDLLEAAAAARGDEVRVVVLDAEGPAFCAGGDLELFQGFVANGASDEITRLVTSLHAGIVELTSAGVPVVACVQGVAAGAGLSLVAACDLAIAARSARFTLAYTKAGLTPDGGSTYFLPRIIGLQRATELALTNRMLSAEEALEWGLVNAVVDVADLASSTTAMIEALRAGAPGAQRATKALLRDALSATLDQQLEAEAAAMIERFSTLDGREGITAFLERRPPRFSGD